MDLTVVLLVVAILAGVLLTLAFQAHPIRKLRGRAVQRFESTMAVAPKVGECGERAGHYRIHWLWPDQNGSNAYFALPAHDDSPTLSLWTDYVGPLCPHERQILAGDNRSVAIPTGWRFEVTEA